MSTTSCRLDLAQHMENRWQKYNGTRAGAKADGIGPRNSGSTVVLHDRFRQTYEMKLFFVCAPFKCESARCVRRPQGTYRKACVLRKPPGIVRCTEHPTDGIDVADPDRQRRSRESASTRIRRCRGKAPAVRVDSPNSCRYRLATCSSFRRAPPAPSSFLRPDAGNRRRAYWRHSGSDRARFAPSTVCAQSARERSPIRAPHHGPFPL